MATHPPVPIKQGKSLKQIDNEVDYKASQNGKWTTEQQLKHEAMLEKEWMKQEDKRGEREER